MKNIARATRLLAALALALTANAQQNDAKQQPLRRIVILDRQGKTVSTVGEPGTYNQPALSPDAKRVAVVRDRQIWVLDVASGAAKQLTSSAGNKAGPAWSPDGRQVAYTTPVGSGGRALYRVSADGNGKEDLVYQGPTLNLTDWSNDDRYWTFFGPDPNDTNSKVDLWMIPVRGERKLIPFVHTAANELGPRVSANARFVGYRSDESGKEEIYVRPFDPAAPSTEKWKVSTNGGMMVRWRRDNQELYYLSGDGQFMVVPVSASGAFKAEAPKPLFRVPEEFTRSVTDGLPGGRMDISDDGTKFLLLMPAPR